MSKTKTELQEELELVREELRMAEAELQKLKEDARKAIKNAKINAQRLSNKLEEERKALYNEAKDVYSQSLRIARDVYKSFDQQVAANLGIVAGQVREQVMFTLKQIFGDDL